MVIEMDQLTDNHTEQTSTPIFAPDTLTLHVIPVYQMDGPITAFASNPDETYFFPEELVKSKVSIGCALSHSRTELVHPISAALLEGVLGASGPTTASLQITETYVSSPKVLFRSQCIFHSSTVHHCFNTTDYQWLLKLDFELAMGKYQLLCEAPDAAEAKEAYFAVRLMPSRVEMTPDSIVGYHHQREKVRVMCAVTNVFPVGKITILTCLTCADLQNIPVEERRSLHSIQVSMNISLDHYKHHKKR